MEKGKKPPKASWNATRRKWEAKGVNPDTGKRRSFYGDSAKQAEAKALASFGLDPLEAEATETLYGFYARIYLPTVVTRSEGWKSQIGWAMDSYVLPAFGDLALADITRSEAQRFFNRLTTQIKASSIRRVKIVFSAVMNLAEDDDLIPKNPIRSVRLAPAQPPEKRALTFKQLAALLRRCPLRMRPSLILMASGLRLGESCAVRRTEVTDGLVRVRRQILQQKGGATDTDVLKTPQSRREVPLPDEVIEMLLGSGQVSDIWVASNSTGGYLLPNNVCRELEKLVGNEDVPRITPHELRHTTISLLENELECPAAIVAALAGRKGGGVNEGYSHTHRKQLEKWMGVYWGRILEQMSADIEDKGCLQLA